jgi:hypothetical protein
VNLDNLTTQQIRRLFAIPKTDPPPLSVPEVDPSTVTEAPDTLAAQVRVALERILHLHVEIVTSSAESGGVEIRTACWRFDLARPPFLELAGKLKAVAPERYQQICVGYEHIYLQPYSRRESAAASYSVQHAIDRTLDRHALDMERRIHTTEPEARSDGLRSFVGY